MIKRVSDIGRVITGKTPSSQHPEHFGTYLPFVTPSDMDGRRRIELPERWLSEAGADAHRSRIVERAVAVSCIGWQMGKSVLIDRPSVTNQQLNSIVLHEEDVDLLFVYYSMLAKRDDIFRRGSGGSRTPILNKTDFERLELWVPPLDVQRAISGLLGALDDKIELNRHSNRNMAALAVEFFRSWFVDFDPVAAKRDGRTPVGMPTAARALFPSHFQDSEVGPIPQGWHIVPLDSAANFLNGLALQRYPPRGAEELPVIKIAELRAGTSVGADRCGGVPPEYVIDDGDVVFSWSGSLMVDVWCGGKGALNQHLFKVTSSEVPKWFYLAWLHEHLPEFQRIAADKATTMGHIRRFHLTEAKVLVPPESLMKAMTSVQQPLLDQIIQNRLESRTLAELRDALLAPLLSGELTIRSAESTVGAAL